jgi:hypothetical protein
MCIRHNADMNSSNGTLGGCDLYKIPRHFIKGRAFVRLAGGRDRTRVEEGANTSTVTLRVVGGNEKGSLKHETVKYGH